MLAMAAMQMAAGGLRHSRGRWTDLSFLDGPIDRTPKMMTDRLPR